MIYISSLLYYGLKYHTHSTPSYHSTLIFNWTWARISTSTRMPTNTHTYLTWFGVYWGICLVVVFGVDWEGWGGCWEIVFYFSFESFSHILYKNINFLFSYTQYLWSDLSFEFSERSFEKYIILLLNIR